MKTCKHCGSVRDTWPLTAAQAEVMKLLSDGCSYTEICAKLKLAQNTVTMRAHRAVERLHCSTVLQAMRKLAESGYFKE